MIIEQITQTRIPIIALTVVAYCFPAILYYISLGLTTSAKKIVFIIGCILCITACIMCFGIGFYVLVVHKYIITAILGPILGIFGLYSAAKTNSFKFNYNNNFELKQQAKQGNVESLYELGMLLLEKNEAPEAEEYFKKAAENNHVASMKQLAYMYLESEDVCTAKEWLEKAAQQGDAEATSQLKELETI